MPTYEYECTRCGHRFERFQSMTDKPVKRCPECRCKVERVLSGGAGFIFKGSGFYITDYRSADYKKKASDEKRAASSEEKKGKSEGTGKKEKTEKTEKKGKD